MSASKHRHKRKPRPRETRIQDIVSFVRMTDPETVADILLIRERLRKLHGDDWEWDDAEWEEIEAQLVADGTIRHLPPRPMRSIRGASLQ